MSMSYTSITWAHSYSSACGKDISH